jgi:putative tricarboxylic transport membrane protein
VTPAIVSHEGGGDMMLNVLNGTLDIGIGEIQELRSQLEAGKITLLATFNPERIADKPDVPTVKELGYDVTLVKFRGLAGPKGIPEETAAIWDEAIKNLLADPEYKKAYSAEVLVPKLIAHKDYPAFINDFATETEAFLKATSAVK